MTSIKWKEREVELTSTAIGNDIADDRSQLLADAIKAKAAKSILKLKPEKVYKITDTLVFPANLDIDFNGAQIHYAGTKDRPAVVFGNNAEINDSPKYSRIDVACDPDITYANDNYVAVRFVRMNCGNVEIENTEGATIGLQLYGDNGSIGYSTFWLTRLVAHKYHIDFYSVNGGITSWINQNTFYGGRFQVYSTQPAATIAVYAIRFRADATGYNAFNNNKFYSPSFELWSANAGIDRAPWLLDTCGYDNKIEDARIETGQGNCLTANSSAACSPTNNSITTLYFNANFTNLVYEPQSAAGVCAYNNRVIPTRTTAPEALSRYDSGNLFSKAFGKSNTGTPKVSTVRVLDHLFLTGSSGTLSQDADNIEIINGYIQLNAVQRALGVLVDTTTYKRFFIDKVTHATKKGRIVITCYASDGTRLSGTTPYYCSGQSMTSSANYGGCYQDSSASNNRRCITFNSSVAYAFIGVSTVSISSDAEICAISSFSITAMDFTSDGIKKGGLRVFTNFESSVLVSSAKPDTNPSGGKVNTGLVIASSTPTAGQPAFWQCSSGTYNAVLWEASTAVKVDYLRKNGGNVYKCTTAGTTAASGGPTGTGTGITDGTAVWDYLGVAATFLTGPNLV